jgi:hypothetical protein
VLLTVAERTNGSWRTGTAFFATGTCRGRVDPDLLALTPLLGAGALVVWLRLEREPVVVWLRLGAGSVVVWLRFAGGVVVFGVLFVVGGAIVSTASRVRLDGEWLCTRVRMVDVWLVM